MKKLIHIKPDLSKLPGGYEPNTFPFLMGGEPELYVMMDDHYGKAFVIENALTGHDCDRLIEMFKSAPVSAPVSVTGYMDGDATAKYGGAAGSVRTTMWAPGLSEMLWEIIRPFFGPREMSEFTSTDWWQSGVTLGGHLMKPDSYLLATDMVTSKKMYHRHWMPIGLTPMMRFMRYNKSGEHYAHYDAGYIYPGGDHRTLMSYVVYLTTNNTGGTRFIKDGQENKPVWDRKHDDWTERATQEDVIHCNHPTKGNILVFDHRLCHDVEQFMPADENEVRMIIRGDVIYQKYNKRKK